MDLNRLVGTFVPDNLISGIVPSAEVVSVTLRRLGTAATLARGTLLERSSLDGLLVILGSTEAAAIDAAAALYEITADVAIAAGKTYYTRSGSAGSYVYTAVVGPLVGNIANYWEMTAAAVTAVAAESLTPVYVLAEDTPVGIAADVVAVAFRSGCFSPAHVTVAAEYTITAADLDALRIRDIVFKDFQA